MGGMRVGEIEREEVRVKESGWVRDEGVCVCV